MVFVEQDAARIKERKSKAKHNCSLNINACHSVNSFKVCYAGNGAPEGQWGGSGRGLISQPLAPS